MSQTATPAPAPTMRAVMAALVDGADVPGWVRVGYAAWLRLSPVGHTSYAPGELGRLLDLEPQQLSHALAVARRRGVVDPSSTAWCLALPGCASDACEGRHR